METPEGFTKVSTGKYTKGDYTYTVNGTTGAVTATKGAEEPTEQTIVGQYRNPVLSAMGSGSGEDMYFDFQEDGTLIFMANDENNPTQYQEMNDLCGSYTYDENTKTGRIFLNVFSDEMVEEGAQFTVHVTANNFIIFTSEISGFELMAKNGMTDFEAPDTSLIGTYSDGTTQYEVSVKTMGDVQYGNINTSGSTNDGIVFFMLEGDPLSFSDDSIEFTTSGSDTILTINGVNYTKQ